MVGGEPAYEGGPRRGRSPFLDRLYRQAGHRWLVLLVALAILLWLGVYAGQVRNPGAVKRQWAVLISRILAAAGGIFLARLLLLSHEERVPVLFFDLRSPGGTAGVVEMIGDLVRSLERRGYEIVPLGDVVEFVRDRRYVPKKCLGLVLETISLEELDRIGQVLAGTEVAVLFPLTALGDGVEPGRSVKISANISLGVDLSGSGVGDGGRLESLAGEARVRLEGLTGVGPRYVRVGPSPGIDLRGVLKGTAYTCFLDGKGFNRFGDEAHLLRLMDTTAFVGRKHAVTGLATYAGLFKGRYYLWPVAAAFRLRGAGREGN